MADQPISGLTALTAAATGDLLEIVDVSDTTMAATGTNKKITAGQVLASGLPGSFSTLAASGAVTGQTGAFTKQDNGNWTTTLDVVNSGTTAGSYGGLRILSYSAASGANWPSLISNKPDANGSAVVTTVRNTAGTYLDIHTISSTGLAVTGAVSATGGLSVSCTNPAFAALVTTVSGVAAGVPNWSSRASRGTEAAPTAVNSADVLMRIYGNGYGASAYKAGALINVIADGTFTDTSSPAYCAVSTTPSGSTTPVERIRFPSAGGVQAVTTISVGNATPSASGAGITFPATQSASTDPNTLDDYETGYHTVTITTETSGTVTVNGSFNQLQYTKVGRLMTVSGMVGIATVSSPVGTYIKVSLPTAIASLNQTASRSVGSCTLNDVVKVLQGTAGNAFCTVFCTVASLTGGDQIYVSFSYVSA